MSISIYEGKVRRNTRPLQMLMAVNVLFAAAVVFAWAILSWFVAEPVAWATWGSLYKGSKPDLMDYPFVMLWAGPIGLACLAWLAMKGDYMQLAYTATLLPGVMLGLILGWYHLAPLAWH